MNPHNIGALLGQPALVAGEDISHYNQLRDALLDELRPSTMAERLLARDIIAAGWELLRLHGFKAGMLNAHMLDLLKAHARGSGRSIGRSGDPLAAVLKLFRGTLAGDREARAKLEKLLEKFQVTLQDVGATAFQNNIVPQIQTDAMINAALQRREAAYVELERRRSNLPQLSSVEGPKLLPTAEPPAPPSHSAKAHADTIGS